MTEELLANAYIQGASDLLQGKIEGMPKVVVIPNNATNGDMIKAITNREPMLDVFDNPYMVFSKDWWNEPYKKEVEENDIS